MAKAAKDAFERVQRRHSCTLKVHVLTRTDACVRSVARKCDAAASRTRALGHQVRVQDGFAKRWPALKCSRSILASGFGGLGDIAQAPDEELAVLLDRQRAAALRDFFQRDAPVDE